MEKDNFLLNIYLKIHNKRPITMDDLRYLAQYDPECFEKTCKNVVYNLPETKPIMEPATTAPLKNGPAPQPTESFNVRAILENLKQLETDEYFFVNVDADRVKNLLGNLYMELLFPHNDKDTFIHMLDEGKTSSFDMKA
ncbi:MAG: hypothetical protein E7292_09115 [Lachnospiraceae bacterium]|nr:hypothetical protein [Lachnospiraceae bacterium]